MGEVGVTSSVAPLTMLRDREELVRIYIGGHFQEKSLGEWAKEAIVKIDHEVIRPSLNSGTNKYRVEREAQE